MTVWLCLLAAIFAGLLGSPSVTVAARLSTANVMAPLDLDLGDHEHNWRAFRQQLQIAKTMGVDAVTVDVWWGKVEKPGDNQFDWSYYDRILGEIESAGLHWVPIMSFHQCGGNVGDECDIPIPAWIWTHYEREGVSRGALQYKSERDKFNGETVSLWQDHVIMPQYREFMRAFQEHFAAKAGITDEINVSLGPAGELRYPSYNAHDDTHDGRTCGFPTRGCFQAYSEPARADFRAYVLAKYRDLHGVNAAWQDSLSGHTLGDVSQIGPPDDNDNSTFRANGFIARGDHLTKQYGRDFVDWYNHALVEHGRRMIDAAIGAFDGAFRSTPIGVKMPGVHWQMMDKASHPRVAEITAGLIQTSLGDLSGAVR
jgi:beta-amylase